MYNFKQQHGAYAGEHINNFIASLGEFFQKYITRSLLRIETEIREQQARTALDSINGSNEEIPSVEAFKARLHQMRRQMFGHGSSSLHSSGDSRSSSNEHLDQQQQQQESRGGHDGRQDNVSGGQPDRQ